MSLHCHVYLTRRVTQKWMRNDTSRGDYCSLNGNDESLHSTSATLGHTRFIEITHLTSILAAGNRTAIKEWHSSGPILVMETYFRYLDSLSQFLSDEIGSMHGVRGALSAPECSRFQEGLMPDTLGE